MPVSLTESPITGGLEGARIAAALALSLGIHAGMAAWIELPGQDAAPVAPGPVQVRLVSPGTRGVTPLAFPGSGPERIAPVPRLSAARRAAPLPQLLPDRLRAEPAARLLSPPVTLLAPAKPDSTVTPVARVAPAKAVVHAAPEEANLPAAPGSTTPATAKSPPAPPAAVRQRRVATAAVAATPPPRSQPRTRSEAPPGTARIGDGRTQAATGASASSGGTQRATAPVAAPRPPSPLSDNPKPRYPMIARRRGQQGQVLVRLDVDADGTPSAARVVSSSGVKSLDEAAREAVSRWRFEPARRQGRAEAATVDVPVEFRLDGSG